MKLAKLLDSVQVLEYKNVNLDSEISSVAYHSGKVISGGIFVCIKGYKTDGHKYLPMATEKGATVAVVEDFQDIDIPQIRVEDSRIALAEISANYYDHPSRKMTVIGITATNGKTTTAFMIDEILKAAGKKTGIVGTVVIKAGDTVIPSELTTPESLELQKYMSIMVEAGVSHLTMEVSSSALDLHRVHGVDFDFACFNNVSREHIDLHGSFEEYFNIKSSLIRNLKAEAKAVVNGDEPMFDILKSDHKNTYSYGVETSNSQLFVSNLDISSGFPTWTVNSNLDSKQACIFDLKLSVPGYHSVYNAMAATEIALLAGFSVDQIQQGLLNFKGVERRFQMIYDKEFKIIDDHFANVGNINVTLETLKKMQFNKLHLIYAIRGSRGVIVNGENAEATLRQLNSLDVATFIATRSIGHTTEKDFVTDEEVETFSKIMSKGKKDIPIYDTLTEVIDIALDKVKAGDVILLAGCQGMDSGGKLILEKLAAGKSAKEQYEILLPVKDRVCGI